MTNSALVDIIDTQSFCLFRKTYNIQLHVDFPKIFSPSQSNSKEYFYKETWDFAVFSNGCSRIFNLHFPIQNKQVRLNGRRSIGSHLHLWKICGLWDLWNIINFILSVFYWVSMESTHAACCIYCYLRTLELSGPNLPALQRNYL